MLIGAAILPSAPLLVPGASPTLSDDVARVCDAVDATVERLPAHDLVIVVAADAEPRIHARAEASLAGIGRPDIRGNPPTAADLAERLAEATGLPLAIEDPLPLDLAALLLLIGNAPATVPVVVDRRAAFDDLAAVGARIVEVAEDLRTVVVAAGDLAAGLSERAPLHTVDGAKEFDAAVVHAVDTGRLEALAGLGPEHAERVGARGWAALAALHGALAAAKLGVVRRHYSAPEGVGYLVAQGA